MADRSDKYQISVTVKHVGSGPEDARLIPASVFAKVFNVFYSAIKTTRSSLNLKKSEHEFFVADLRMGSNVFALGEQAAAGAAPCLAALGTSVEEVYASDFGIATENPKLAWAIVGIGKSHNRAFETLVDFNGERQVYVNEHFHRRVQSLERLLVPELSKTEFFAGRAIDSFVGVLSELNSFHDTWTAWLKLEGGKKIECILDKSKGDKEYSECWNKRVSVTGLSVYTGKSLLPESLKVVRIEPIAQPSCMVDIRGSLSGYDLTDWDDLTLADFH